MRVHLFLKAIVVLAFAGLFVAGALSASKIWNLGLPCGAAHGCDLVNNHPSSRWFGVPVAYVGFLGYLLIAGLALLRSGMEAAKARPFALAGYVVSGFGALASVGLQIYSFAVIQATCLWCLTSAALMLLLVFCHALEFSERTSEEVPKGRGEFVLASVLLMAVAVGLFGFTSSLRKAGYMKQVVQEVKQFPLVPKDAHVYGDPSSPVTIVEFADLMCPSCQRVSPEVKKFVSDHPGKVRLVYRSFPLSMHPMGSLSAAVAEASSEDGRFWDFAEAAMATHKNLEKPEEVWAIVQKLGLNETKIRERLADVNGPAMTRLTAGISAANALGVHVTPTFLVQASGKETQAFSFTALMDELQNGEYKSLVEGK